MRFLLYRTSKLLATILLTAYWACLRTQALTPPPSPPEAAAGAAGAAGTPLRQTNDTLRFPLELRVGGYSAEVSLNGLQFLQPVGIVSPPGETNRLFILEKIGRIQVVTNLANPTSTLFLNLMDRVAFEQESGLLGLAFHPQHAQNGFYYVFYTLNSTTDGQTGLHYRVSRFQVSPSNPNETLLGSEIPLINQFDGDPWHQAGQLEFGPDGYLYIAVGDSGGRASEHVQRIDRDFFSGILRIDVDLKPGNPLPNPHPAISGPYAIPADNPFLGATAFRGASIDPSRVRGEFYAVGLRNPWRFSFDPSTGLLYANDTGDTLKEEVNLILKGANYGWPYREGNYLHSLPEIASFFPPLADYDHDEGPIAPGSGKAITGALLYRGNAITNLRGAFIFSDFWSGDLGAIRLAGTELETRLRTLQTQADQLEQRLRQGDNSLAAAQIAWEKSWSHENWSQHWAGTNIDWVVLDPAQFSATGGASLAKLPDSSLLAEGTNAWEETYIVSANTSLSRITAARLEILTHESLPNQGPGRSAGGNVVISEVQLAATPIAAPENTHRIQFPRVHADFAQEGWPAAGMIDADPATGWAIFPQTGQNHAAFFHIETAPEFSQGAKLTFFIRQTKGDAVTLGRFRLSVTGSPPPPESQSIAETLRLPPDQRTQEQAAALAEHYRSIDPFLSTLRATLSDLELQTQTAGPEIALAQQQWEQGWKQEDARWIVLNPDAYSSSGNATLVKRRDLSLVVSGDAPWEDVYTVSAKTDLTQITGFRLETLTDPALPGNGPGRAGGGNFVLTAFHVLASPQNDPSALRWVTLNRAMADFSQTGWDVQEAIKGDPARGWAIWPEMGKPHHAIFETDGGAGFPQGSSLFFFLRQNYGDYITLGRFRLSATTAPQPLTLDPTPGSIAEILRLPPENRDPRQLADLAAYYRTIDPALLALQEKIARVRAALESPDPRFLVAQGDWEEDWRARDRIWRFLDPAGVSSSGGATLQRQPDFSLLVSGTEPWEDEYTIVTKPDSAPITALRLEVLPDPALPGNGPGRTASGNFVLSELEVFATPADNSSGAVKVELANPSADFAQKDWGVERVIDGNPKTGWAIYPAMGQPHQAVFEFKNFRGFPSGAILAIILKQTHGDAITIGRFRLSATSNPLPVKADPVPNLVAAILRTPLQQRSPADRSKLTDYFRSIDSGAVNFQNQLAAIHAQQIDAIKENPLPIQWIGRYPGIASFATHPNSGEILMADMLQGFVRRLQPVSDPVELSPIPPTLAEAGIFSDLRTLAPNPGIVPYSINAPFWSDHAIKSRWFSIPNTNRAIGFSPEGNWDFPPGTFWIKHFEMEMTNGIPASARRLETRVLVRGVEGAYGLTYRWDPQGANAFLVPDGGARETLLIRDGDQIREQVWLYPSRAQCMQCHTAAGGLALGFNTAQLNLETRIDGARWNQLEALAQAGYFAQPITPLHTLPSLAPISQSNVSREFRVRSYFHANCVQCHQPGGSGRSPWDARFNTPTDLTQLINVLPSHTLPGQTPGQRLIKPGSVEDSILMRRLASLDNHRMPPLGSTVINQAALDLLSAWITEDLPKRRTFQEWRVEFFPDPNDPSSAENADPDSDGASNWIEFLTGTHPLQSADYWKVTLDHRDGVRLIRFPRAANRRYEVQWTANLFDNASWTPLNTPSNRPFYSSENGEAVVEHPDPEPTAAFYRVLVFGP